jgi:hypothetical protein
VVNGYDSAYFPLFFATADLSSMNWYKKCTSVYSKDSNAVTSYGTGNGYTNSGVIPNNYGGYWNSMSLTTKLVDKDFLNG